MRIWGFETPLFIESLAFIEYVLWVWFCIYLCVSIFISPGLGIKEDG